MHKHPLSDDRILVVGLLLIGALLACQIGIERIDTDTARTELKECQTVLSKHRRWNALLNSNINDCEGELLECRNKKPTVWH